MNDVDNKPTQYRLEQLAEHEAFKEKDEAILCKNWKEVVQLLTEVEDHRQAFMEKVGVFETMWDGQLGCIIAAKHWIDPSNVDV